MNTPVYMYLYCSLFKNVNDCTKSKYHVCIHEMTQIVENQRKHAIEILNINCFQGPSGSWSHGSWIYNFLCNRCLSSLMLWVRNPLRARYTALYDKDCQRLYVDRWFSTDTPVSSTNETDRDDIAVINCNYMYIDIASAQKRK